MKTIIPELRRRKWLAAVVRMMGRVGTAVAAFVLLLTSMLFAEADEAAEGEKTTKDRTAVDLVVGSPSQMQPHPALSHLTRDTRSGSWILAGIASVAGLGLGEAVVVSPAVELDSVPDKLTLDREAESLRFRQEVAAELAEINRLSERLQPLLPADNRELFDAYGLLLSSDSLVNDTLERIQQGHWAPGAWRTTVLEYAKHFENMESIKFQGRSGGFLE